MSPFECHGAPRASCRLFRNSHYASGRSNDWGKVTCAQRETLPIAGFALKDKRFDSLYVGRQKRKELVYAGKVDHGFDTSSAKDLQARLKPLIRKTQPYAKKIAYRGVWVEPSLLAEIEYRAKSAEGKVRHPFFKGIREDMALQLSSALSSTDGVIGRPSLWIAEDFGCCASG
jgi:bifunctional non-homologous end joining protein LigD